MPIELKMPALSPTMEEGTLTKWFVKEGDAISAGDVIAEIETDKASMEFEAVDDGVIEKITVEAGSENVKVGTVIALVASEGEEAKPADKSDASKDEKNDKQAAPAKSEEQPAKSEDKPAEPEAGEKKAPASRAVPAIASSEDRVKATPLARRLAESRGIDLAAVEGTGPNGRIIKADLEGVSPAKGEKVASADASAPTAAPSAPSSAVQQALAETDIPHEAIRLSNMRKTIARRLTESKQQVPHIYLTVDVRLDALLALRTELNASLADRGVKLSVNDLLIKALAIALIQVPECNVRFTGDQLLQFTRADISVAVSIPGGLITPIITGADTKSISKIAAEMKDLAERAREGKLKPEEYQGGTASLSNMGMMGITQFDAVINPPQAMILAIGAGEKRPYVVDDALTIATVMSATGSFDHRAIDGADGARLMASFKALVEKPLGLLA